MPKLNELSLQFLKFPGNNLPMRTCNLYPGISRNFCWLKPWSLSISLSVSISFLLWHCNNKEHLFSLSGVNWGRLLPDYSACTKVWNTKLGLGIFPVRQPCQTSPPLWICQHVFRSQTTLHWVSTKITFLFWQEHFRGARANSLLVTPYLLLVNFPHYFFGGVL